MTTRWPTYVSPDVDNRLLSAKRREASYVSPVQVEFAERIAALEGANAKLRNATLEPWGCPTIRYRMNDAETGLNVTVVVARERDLTLNRECGVWGCVYDTPGWPDEHWPDVSGLKFTGKMKSLTVAGMQVEIKEIARRLLSERIYSEVPRLSETGWLLLNGGRCSYCKRKVEDSALCLGCGAAV